MYEGWTELEFDRLPTVYEYLGAIKYKLFLKKDSKDHYWMISYSIKQPAFRYIGCIKNEHNDIIESKDIDKISELLINSGAFVSYMGNEDAKKVFDILTSWKRSNRGYDRLNLNDIWFDSIEDYLQNYTSDEDIIQTIHDSLAIFCKS